MSESAIKKNREGALPVATLERRKTGTHTWCGQRASIHLCLKRKVIMFVLGSGFEYTGYTIIQHKSFQDSQCGCMVRTVRSEAGATLASLFKTTRSG